MIQFRYKKNVVLMDELRSKLNYGYDSGLRCVMPERFSSNEEQFRSGGKLFSCMNRGLAFILSDRKTFCQPGKEEVINNNYTLAEGFVSSVT